MIKREGVQLPKVVLTFLIGGLASGVAFGWFITRASLKYVWFEKGDKFIFPTWRFWLLTVALFLLGIVASWGFCFLKGWLSLHFDSYLRLFLALILLGTLPIILNSHALMVPVISSFLIGPLVLACFLTLTLFAITGRWQGITAKWIIVASFVISPLAVIPDAVMASPIPVGVFAALRFLIASSLLITLTGCWLAKAMPAGPNSNEAH